MTGRDEGDGGGVGFARWIWEGWDTTQDSAWMLEIRLPSHGATKYALNAHKYESLHKIADGKSAVVTTSLIHYAAIAV